MPVKDNNLLDAFRPAVAVVLLWANIAWAQDAPQPVQPVEGIRLDLTDRPVNYYSAITKPEPIAQPQNEIVDLGGEKPRALSLRLATGLGYDSNVFRTERNTQSGYFWNVRPALLLNGRVGKHNLGLGYEGDYRTYFDFSTEDYYDHRIFATANLDLTRKIDVNLSGQVWWGHDPRGSMGARVINPGDLDTWRESRVRAELVAGREITRAQVTPWIEYSTMRYLDNNQSDRNYDVGQIGVRGRWRFNPRFYGLAEGSLAQINYTDPSNNLDRDESNLLVGFGWQATAKTSGEILVGILNQNFDDPGRGDTTNFDWNARVFWSPKPYSKVTAFTRRTARDDPSGGQGTFLANTIGIEWRHAFSQRLELNTAIEYSIADYDSPRTDKYLQYDLSVSRGLTQWLDVVASYQYLGRRSNIPGLNYDDNMILLELRAGKNFGF
jgi:hypothetical protein